MILLRTTLRKIQAFAWSLPPCDALLDEQRVAPFVRSATVAMLPCSVPKRKIAVRNETDGAITRTAVTIERAHPPYRMSFDHRISDPQERAAFKRAEHSERSPKDQGKISLCQVPMIL